MDKEKSNSLNRYWPLIVVFLVSILAALALARSDEGAMASVMHHFMGIFLLIFATLKLFNPVKFADGFSMYDILAEKTRIYAFVYPVLELLLALAYLAFFMPFLIYLLTIVLMTFGAIGVYRGLQKGLDINCPCMGSILNVPLSTVSLIENVFMAVMAFILLVHSIINWF